MEKLSKPERLLYDYLTSRGWIHQPKTYLPYTFTDPEGTIFNAMGDYYHPVYNAWIEVKDSELNGIKCKRTAEMQSEAANLRPSYKSKASFFWIKHGWNHSVHKNSIVQKTIPPGQFLVIFTGNVNDANIKRMVNAGLHAYSFKKIGLALMILKIRHSLGFTVRNTDREKSSA